MTLTASSLSIQRSERLVLTDVTFSLKAGDCLILKGPNGSGKTSLLRALAGLCPIPFGNLEINLEDAAYLGHLDAIKPNLTVQENLSFWREIYGQPSDIDLNALGISHLTDRLAGRLSAGQKRRLSFARMLQSDAGIWLLDEPTNSLDKQGTKDISKLIDAHCKNGGIAVVSSHHDLPIKTARELNIAEVAPKTTTLDDPFLAKGI